MAGVTGLSWFKTRPSAGPLILGYPEAAGQTFTKTSPVNLDTAGRVKLAIVTEGDSVASLAGFYGVAQSAASGTTDANLRVLIAQPGDIFAVSASASGATRTVIRTDVGLECGWILSTVTGETSKAVLDVSNTGATELVFQIIDTLDAVGTVDGRYLARVSPTSWGTPRAA